MFFQTDSAITSKNFLFTLSKNSGNSTAGCAQKKRFDEITDLILKLLRESADQERGYQVNLHVFTFCRVELNRKFSQFFIRIILTKKNKSELNELLFYLTIINCALRPSC
jgi:hypothetical protein